MQVSDKLDWTISSLGFLLPEIILSVGILALIVAGLISRSKNFTKFISLSIAISNTIILLFTQNSEAIVNLFSGMLQVDGFSFFIRLLIGFACIVVIIISDQDSINQKYPSEYFTLILTIALGAQLLCMSSHFVMVILSLELMSIPAYVLAGFGFDKSSAEATMKYFIYGSIATAFLIFGVSWIYGLSESLNFANVAFASKLKFNDHELFLGAGLLVIGGLLFKMASTPFHFWAPDVYQTASMPVLTLFSTIPKVAAGALLIKLIGIFSIQVDSKYDWQSIIAVISIMTLTVGNFSALVQKNVKRLMAYSSIGQAGFLIVSASTLTTSGNQFFIFYCATLILATSIAFLSLRHFERVAEATQVSDFSGLGIKLPAISVLLTIAMISLAGLPITAGFTGKLFIFTGLLDAWNLTGKSVLIWLFGFGLLNTVISLYYYLRVPYYLFLKKDLQKEVKPEKALLPILFGGILSVILLWLFFQPDSLMGWINSLTFVP